MLVDGVQSEGSKWRFKAKVQSGDSKRRFKEEIQNGGLKRRLLRAKTLE